MLTTGNRTYGVLIILICLTWTYWLRNEMFEAMLYYMELKSIYIHTGRNKESGFAKSIRNKLKMIHNFDVVIVKQAVQD
jgi:hypothetical protein